MRKWLTGSAVVMLLPAAILHAAAGPRETDDAFRGRPAEAEVVYFLLPDRFENGDATNDRGGLRGDRLVTGFDPTSKGFYHGGDLAGLRKRLDYISSLGATAVWLGPVYRNKPVQGPAGEESAGYHGYWVTDFTSVDPHFGTAADMQGFVDDAHARDLKVYLDIITNHTADVIGYAECPNSSCAYRPTTEEPYTPLVRNQEARVKVPAWLNDPQYYHNRGDSTFRGESSQLGDFVGLDDLMTEHPRVVAGFIEIYADWIRRFGVDGFRIDTAKHVNPEFWQAFVPAMRSAAAAAGIPNFHVFGEVAVDSADNAQLAAHTHVAALPAVLDFGFRNVVRDTVAGDAGTSALTRLFATDVLYAGGEAAARQLPTFVSNHDDGRFAHLVRQRRPQIAADELTQRVVLAHAMLLTLRGVPVLYYGDEQGFVGLGSDQASRQDMFASQVASYNDQPLLGTSERTSTSSFERRNALRETFAGLVSLRRTHPALLRGRQVTRADAEAPGIFAVSRFDPNDGHEIVIAFNTSTSPLATKVRVEPVSQRFEALAGQCAKRAGTPAHIELSLPPLGFVVCEAVSAREGVAP